MKRLIHTLFTILFATSLACINAPLFDNRKHEIFAKTSHEWIQVWRGIKSNGFQKFTIHNSEVWALNIEKAISKYCKQFGLTSFDVTKAEGTYFVFVNLEG